VHDAKRCHLMNVMMYLSSVYCNRVITRVGSDTVLSFLLLSLLYSSTILSAFSLLRLLTLMLMLLLLML